MKKSVLFLILTLSLAIAAIAGYGVVSRANASVFPAADIPVEKEPVAADGEKNCLPKYRFHCEKDTAEIAEFLMKLEPLRDKSNGELIIAATRLLEGRPYVAHTLEGDTEQMVINVDGLDCVTFVENCFALAKTVRNGGRSWRDFARNIEDLRYRHGKQKAYDSRLHYTTDWIIDNIYRGNIEEVTTSVPDYRSVTKTLNFMTTHRDAYPALADSAVYAGCRKVEAGLFSMRIPYVTKSMTSKSSFVDCLQDGDMISFVSPKDGLDSSHVALLRIVNGKPLMMHASMKKGKVTFETAPLFDYLKYNKRDCPGVRVVRLK